jgi:predicted NUDIX family NTP pyrophosphohydrolase
MSSIAPNVSAGLLLFRSCATRRNRGFSRAPESILDETRRRCVDNPKGAPTTVKRWLTLPGANSRKRPVFVWSGRWFSLGDVLQKSGKRSMPGHVKANADPARTRSNNNSLSWPPRSGKWVEVPEIDRCAWFDLVLPSED